MAEADTHAKSVPPKTPLILNARDFGAKGDGATKDTAAMQQAIDRCSVLGGGEVLVPAGNYLTGALALRSNTILRLEKDATILGTPDFADYPVSQVRWEGKWIPGPPRTDLRDRRQPHRRRGARQDRRQQGARRPAQPQNPLRHPALVEPIGCRDVRLEDFSTDQQASCGACIPPTAKTCSSRT